MDYKELLNDMFGTEESIIEETLKENESVIRIAANIDSIIKILVRENMTTIEEYEEMSQKAYPIYLEYTRNKLAKEIKDTIM